MPNIQEDGQVLHGQLYDNETGILRAFTQQMQNCDYGGTVTALGQPATEVIPQDANAALVKRFFPDNEKTDLLTQFYSVAMTVDQIRLPDELISINVIFSKSGGNGSDTGTGGGSGTTGSASANVDSTGSAGITADVQLNIKPHWGDNVPGLYCYFYTDGAAGDMATVISKLTTELGQTVNPWPVFHPETHTITVTGESVSATAKGSAQESVNSSGETWTKSSGSSLQFAPSVRSIDIPPTIHRALVITNTSDSKTITVAAGVTLTVFGIAAVVGGASVPSQTVTGSVSPTSFSQTDPSNIPTDGYYLYNLRPQFSRTGLFLNIATVVDMAYFQSPIVDFNYNDGAITLTTGSLHSVAPDFAGGFPDSYALHSGSLPSGMSLNTTTGIISGTIPAFSSSQTFTIRATNSKGYADAILAVTVVAP